MSSVGSFFSYVDDARSHETKAHEFSLRVLVFWDVSVTLLTVPSIVVFLGEFLQRRFALEEESSSVHERHKDTAVFRNVGNCRPCYTEELNLQYQRCGNLKYRIWFGFEIDR